MLVMGKQVLSRMKGQLDMRKCRLMTGICGLLTKSAETVSLGPLRSHPEESNQSSKKQMPISYYSMIVATLLRPLLHLRMEATRASPKSSPPVVMRPSPQKLVNTLLVERSQKHLLQHLEVRLFLLLSFTHEC